MTCINLSTLGALIHAIFATTLRGMYYYHHSIGVCLFLALFSIIPRPFEILGGGGQSLWMVFPFFWLLLQFCHGEQEILGKNERRVRLWYLLSSSLILGSPLGACIFGLKPALAASPLLTALPPLWVPTFPLLCFFHLGEWSLCHCHLFGLLLGTLAQVTCSCGFQQPAHTFGFKKNPFLNFPQIPQCFSWQEKWGSEWWNHMLRTHNRQVVTLGLQITRTGFKPRLITMCVALYNQ